MGVFFACFVGGISMMIDSVFNYDEQSLHFGLLFIFFGLIPFIITDIRSHATREACVDGQTLYNARLGKILAWIEKQEAQDDRKEDDVRRVV